jgi:ADP-ribosyl-[dinitrogen reductase] hydrolase
MHMSEMADRYRGCLLGLACGDALGGPVEFKSRDWIAERYPSGVRDFVGGGWLHLAPGEITDDTQMTLALARSLAEGGRLDAEDVGRQFLSWYRSRPKDIGNTTRAALAYLDAGMPWDDAGDQVQREAGAKGAAGNGAVMRCAPVALRYRADPGSVRSASIDTSRITHADPRCTWSAVAVNQAIVHLLAGGDLAGLARSATAGIDEPRVVEAVERAGGLGRDTVRSGGYVLDTVTAACWALLHHDTLEETIIAAVSLGDDADTTGAVAGALAGARYGAAAIPDRWLKLLQPREELTDLADRLLGLSLAG